MSAVAVHEVPTALVIDDDAVMRITIEDCLEEAGMRVVAAEDAITGLDAFEATTPDIVLLDVNMPGMDGFTLCRKLREKSVGAHVPVLMMTGSDDVHSVKQAFQAGATDFTSKPLNPDLLVHRVHYMLRAKDTADALRDRERSLAYAQRIARLGNWELDPTTGLVECSDALVEIAALDGNHVSIETLLERVHVDDRARMEQAVSAAISCGTTSGIEYRLTLPGDSEIIVHQDTELLTDSDGRRARVLAAVQDISERRAAESRIRELAYFDNVTGLPNRAFLNEELERALAAAARHSRILAVLFVDLDDFKRINDTWGHAVGDELLAAVARRLKAQLRNYDYAGRVERGTSFDADTVVRLGGDEFVVVVSELERPEDAAVVARRINLALSEAFEVRSTEVYIGGSIGISVYPDDATDGGTLLRNADSAMYEAKAVGRNGYHFYTEAIQGRAFERLSLETSLRRGIEQQEFRLHFQPKVDIQSQEVVGMEALLRWDSADLGSVSPAEFIPIAEQSGLIVPLGEWVLHEACRQTRQWQEEGLDELCVSVNLSVAQFAKAGLATLVADVLSQHRLPGPCLELELTESILMNDTPSCIRLLETFKEIGVKLSIDDFGTGYSSLRYLKQLPVDTLKVDRSFIQDMEHDEDDRAIVAGTISLAHSLRLRTVAEGVEDSRQLELLRKMNCNEVQGYFFSRPLPPDEMANWIREQRATWASVPHAVLQALPSATGR